MSRIRAREKGFVWIFTAMTMILIIPMIGLAIDASVLYIVKAKLQGAVDGAALAGARALARGADGTTQIASAQSAARGYVKLNIPDGYLLSTNLVVLQPTVDLSVAFQRKVSVTANVDSPALFMRYIGAGVTTVSASAQAVRRDVNIAMVVDRSGSLTTSGSCGALRAAAVNFVNKFANLRDNISLVTFASSTFVNFPMANNFQSASPNVPSLLNSIVCQGSTSSAMGLWQGYDQLVGLNQAGALNIILFFTDGQPTGVAFNMPIANASGCTASTPYVPAASAPPGAKGFITGLYNTYANQNTFFGSLHHQGTSSGGVQTIINNDFEVAPNSNGCAYAASWSGNVTNTTDFVGVPTTDIFGNSADTAYQPVTHNGIGLIDITNNANAPLMALNAADDAARRIRIGTPDPTYSRSLAGVTIFSIGLGNAAIPASPVFLERVSNDPRSPIYDHTQADGLYVAAPTSADIDSAFSVIASEILRLAK